MYYTDNPIRDFHRYDSDMEDELEKYPCCDHCGERITDDKLYDVCGEILCEECMKELYEKPVEKYIEE